MTSGKRRAHLTASTRRALSFVTRALLFVSAIRVLWLVNQDAERTTDRWWLVPTCLVAVLGWSLRGHRPKLARLVCLGATCIALATIAHGRFAWLPWLLVGILLELAIRCLGGSSRAERP